MLFCLISLIVVEHTIWMLIAAHTSASLAVKPYGILSYIDMMQIPCHWY